VEKGVRIARKHLGWYASGLRDAARFRTEVNRTADPSAVRSLIDRQFSRQDIDLAA